MHRPHYQWHHTLGFVIGAVLGEFNRTVKVAPVLVSIIIYLSFGQVFMIKITLQSGWNSNVWGLFSSALLIRLTRWWNVIAWKIYFWYTVNHFWNDKKKKSKKEQSFLYSLLGYEIENVLFLEDKEYFLIILLPFKPLSYIFIKEDKVFQKICYEMLYVV